MALIRFTREKTQILKGIALLLMLVHHTSNPSYWAEEGSALYTYFGHQVSATKMCVYIFAFLVGYGFFCSSNKSIKYSLKRIALLLVPFWAMLLCMFIPSAYASDGLVNALKYNEIGGGNAASIELIYNMFGISESLNWYSWFVCFYILAILSLPYLHKFYSKFPKWGWLATILGSYVLECAIHTTSLWNTNPLIHNIFIFTSNIPVVIVGYQCGYWNTNDKLPRWFEGKHRIALSILTFLAVLLINSVKIHCAGFCIQAFYTPILIFAVVGIFNSIRQNWLNKVLVKVGDLSMYMWFFHAIFFTTSVNLYTKTLVFEPIHCYIYTLVMTFVWTFIGSLIIKRMLSPVNNRIKPL